MDQFLFRQPVGNELSRTLLQRTPESIIAEYYSSINSVSDSDSDSDSGDEKHTIERKLTRCRRLLALVYKHDKAVYTELLRIAQEYRILRHHNQQLDHENQELRRENQHLHQELQSRKRYFDSEDEDELE